MIEVEVSLYPPLRENRFDRAIVKLASQSSVQSLLQHLAIKEQEVESVYVNGRGGTLAQELNSGDRVSLLPLIGGG